MKRNLIVSLLVMIAVLSSIIVWGETKNKQQGIGLSGTPDGSVGRYQLFQGEHEEYLDAGKIIFKRIFKIDTRTGDAWQYVIFKDDSKAKWGWQKIAVEWAPE